MQYPHLEALHDLGGLPYAEELGPRGNKEAVLEHYGFTKGANPAEIAVFDYADVEPGDMRGHLGQRVNEGKYSALLFRDGKWESMGGCPVVYVMDAADIEEKLTFDDSGRVTQISAGHDTFTPSTGTKVNMYTRRHSVQANLSGFDNHEGAMDVSLGGGFRLQVDDILYEGGKPFLVMSAHFSFNDYGSRVLAKETEADASVPMATKAFRVPIVDGGLVLPVKDVERVDVIDTNSAIDLVLSELFDNDGKAINGLLRDALTIRPAMRVHQLEGIYGVTDENGVSAEVIDFDGLDTFDLMPETAQPSAGERLAGGQLIGTGYLRETDQGTRVTYYRQLAESHASVAQMEAVDTVSTTVKGMAAMRPGEDITGYANRLGAYGRLARSLSYCDLGWEETTAPNVAQVNINGYTITRVEAGGFETAYIERDGVLVPVENARDIYGLTKQILGSSMLRLYVSLSREGD